jgi:hypothetical protein
MQEEEKKNIPMVDIDTSGPEQEVEIQEDPSGIEDKSDATDKTFENERETKLEEASSESQEASSEEQEAQKDAKDVELENYSKDVQRRIAKLTGKWREAQRQRDEAIAFAKLQKEQRESLQKKYSSVEQAGVKDREERIKSGLLAAQTKLAQARANDDVVAEVEAQKEIARLGYEEARLQEAKSLAETVVSKEEEIPVLQQQPVSQPRPDPKAEAWGAKNRWFGSDTAMTYTAFDIHNKLEAEGYDPQSDEYYAEIDKRIRLEFPHKFGNNSNTTAESTKPVQTVASATRSTKPGRKTVRLTPSEVAIAKKLGVSLEDYAKQKKHMKEV